VLFQKMHRASIIKLALNPDHYSFHL